MDLHLVTPLFTPEQRELLAQAAPGTPLGDRLRRHWQPVAATTDLSPDHPIRPVRVLSEALVVYRNLSGQFGLMQERCTHHGALLFRGEVAEHSLICPLHHWRFDVEGNCFVIGYQGHIYPMNWAKARAYPVREHDGLLWAYLGPAPAPPLPDLGAERLIHLLVEQIESAASA